MSMPNPIHLFIATPCYGGQVHQRFMQCAFLLLQYGAANNIRVTLELVGRESLITRGRNMLVSKFMDSKATHLFFIDADIGFEIQQVLRMLTFDRDVVAGMYPLKNIEWNDESLARANAGVPLDYAAIRFVGAPSEGGARDGAFIEGDYAGAGFMMIKREVIAKMFAAYPELKYRCAHNCSEAYLSENQYALFDTMIDPDSKEYLSEDYAFCKRWQKLGGKVWLDTESRLVHIGNHEFFASPAARFPVEVKQGEEMRAAS